jgi:enoyl-CoA hydratase/carnithine racemase
MPDVLRLVVEDTQRGPRLSPDLIASLRDQLSSDTSARVVVIEGGPEAFCEGLDLELLGG